MRAFGFDLEGRWTGAIEEATLSLMRLVSVALAAATLSLVACASIHSTEPIARSRAPAAPSVGKNARPAAQYAAVNGLRMY